MSTSWLFHSGTIFNGRNVLPAGSALAVRNGRILAVGPEAQVRRALPDPRNDVSLADRALSPGFIDAHVHVLMGGVESLACDLTGADGPDDTLAAIASFAATHTGDWITGGGWSMSDFPGGTPTAAMLDPLTGETPTYLVNRDYHGAWVNSAALRLAGITAQTPDPVDGRIERDAHRKPTGTLHEGAMDLVNALIPAPDPAALRAGLLAGQRYLHSFGITGWQEALLGNYAGYADGSPIYRGLLAEGLLTGKAAGALWVPRETTLESVPALVDNFLARRKENAVAGFRTTTAKIMVDGVAENRTAAMLDPYPRSCDCAPDSPDETGLRYLSAEVLTAVAVALDAAGFDLHLHVIGDGAARMGLDALEAARAANGATGGRHHLAHVQVIHPDDVARFGALGLGINAQALWACNDEQMLELTNPILGGERAGWQYPFRSLIDAGAHLVMGSDWPVSTPDPFAAIHVAVNRTEPGHPQGTPLVPEQAITVLEAMRGYTAGSAWVNRDHEGGHLRPGARADLALLDADPFSIPSRDLHRVGVELTLASGHAVFTRATAGV
ncbi:amidohydrolase [Paeniglutamicibacter psychrophenolicus]|uniref:amidohydrolase n=1 Tax=Paeniglutamicibacter psychrophenolicus TaxID=257454 RepID=UPI00277E19D7|nr:amidohydrolase [Paeniglutamicibacter psychrophenolicus]MDQ0095175.1 putative amidohydrolase YtcJ [Paeniglutamicibacter psychrophenolicus]